MFTAAYPYSSLNEWKGLELAVLRRRFSEVYVAPLHQTEAGPAADLPEGVRVLPPVFPKGDLRRSAIQRLTSLISARLPRHLRLSEVPPKLTQWRQYWAAAADVEEIMQASTWQDHVLPLLPGSTLYFFWGRGYAQVLPYLPAELRERSLVRMHRWDLYPDVNGGYVPLQKRIVECAGRIAPISQDGSVLLRNLYPEHADRVTCLRLGTKLRGSSRPSDDGRFRIVSCAYARPVKRLHLIAEALKYVESPVTWTHVGDGPELASLARVAASLPEHVEVEFAGRVAPKEVSRMYEQRPFDLFVNVSESEGIPVSVMEAMAAGIPAFATDVGGNSEIVDERVGCLLTADLSPEELAKHIIKFIAMAPGERQQLRRASRARIEADYDINHNATAVADALGELSSPNLSKNACP